MKFRVTVVTDYHCDKITMGDPLTVYVTEPAKENKANLAVRKLIAKWHGVPRNKVRITSGKRSKTKTIKIDE
jgi:uncharacterized protein YggU (UPF0235/DUF167 family)